MNVQILSQMGVTPKLNVITLKDPTFVAVLMDTGAMGKIVQVNMSLFRE